MSIFERFLVQGRRGAKDSKLWIPWPLTLSADDLDDIYLGLRQSYSARDIQFVVNEQAVPILDHGGSYPSLPSHYIPSTDRSRGIKSVAFGGGNEVWVHLGPRLSYSYSNSNSPEAIAVLWRTQSILKRAKWPLGTFLFRTWGAAIAVTVAAIASAYLFGSEASAAARDVSVILLCIALIVFLTASAYVGVFRRVRVIARNPGERSSSGWLGKAANGVFVGVVVALITSAILSFLGVTR